MAQVKMGFSDLSIPEKIQKAHLIHDSMVNSGNFPNATEELATLDVSNQLLEKAYQDSRDGGKTKVAAMHLRAGEMMEGIVVLAAIVQSVSKGDVEIVRSSGFDVRSAAGSSGLLTQPEGLKVITSAYPGQALLTWKTVDGFRSYNIEKSDDGQTNWTLCGSSTRSDATINGLTSMSYAWFRVIAIGVAGLSPASAAVKGLIG